MRGDEPSARAVQIDGPLLLLELLRSLSIGSWAQVSTAFVCGRRSGIIYESEGDMGQEFHNQYERLKLESEIRIKQACRKLGSSSESFDPVLSLVPPRRHPAACRRTCSSPLFAR
jgi:hypothetical protein